jgi:hypothetical protein
MKYPRIAHVPFSSKTDPDDFFTEMEIFGREWIVTEKVDGAQISAQFIDGAPDVRNRNTDILHGGADRQFHPFPAWLAVHFDALREMLGDRYILFGEWLFHVHTEHYTSLPDWFMGFDVLDKETGEFLPFDEATRVIESAGLRHVPVLGKAIIKDEKHVRSFIGKSSFGDVEMEGVVLHSADGKDRVKFVTERFVQQVNDHPREWRRGPTRERNSLAARAG